MASIEIRPGDAISLFQDIAPHSIDLIIADPPYNLGKDYGNNRDSRDISDYLAFSKTWLHEARRVLTPRGTIYVFMGVRFISHIYTLLEQELGFHFNSWVTWHYTQGIGKTRGFSPRHDDILMFTASKSFTFNLDAVRVPQKFYRDRNNMRGANPGDVWQFSHVHYCQANRQKHPTQKPEALIERMVLASSDAGQRVLDPFAGSGTTLRVCQQLNRHAIGFELNPFYVRMTEDRLAQPFTGFDGIDPRMERIPADLRDPDLRRDYLAKHIAWFLPNHQSARASLERKLRETYGEDGVGPLPPTPDET